MTKFDQDAREFDNWYDPGSNMMSEEDVELLRESVIDKKKNRKSIVKDILKAKTFINKHSSGLVAVIACTSSNFEINLFLENKIDLDLITLIFSVMELDLHKGSGFIISQNKGLQ